MSKLQTTTSKVQEKRKQAVDEKKSKAKRVLKKIEDFNKYARVRAVKEARMKKSLTDTVTLEPITLLKAVKSLQKLKEDQKAQSKLLLEEEDEFIYVEVTLSKLPEEYSIRPYQIKLPVPIYGESYFSKFCVFVKDPSREYKDKIQDLSIPCIAKVIDYTKLQKEHKTYQDKRNLCKEYDLFFCDYRLYDLLRKPLGKFFYDRKKLPFPIDCEKVPEFTKIENYETYLNSLSDYTYFIQNNGPNYGVRVARVTMDAKEVVKNVIAAAHALCAHLLESGSLQPEDIRRIALKTASSPSLPVYSHLSEREKNLLADAIQELKDA